MAILKQMTVLVSGVALSSLVAGHAFAETAHKDAGDGASESNAGLGEIIVTAQRRAESAQSVPIAVVAFNAQSLAASGTVSSADLPTLVAGLTLAPSGPRTPMYLRGVGNNNDTASPAVLTFVDGVYMPFSIGHEAYNDVASIEVAKGPQGTLFGRNATGGVIQVTTMAPTEKPSAEFEVGYANYKTLELAGHVSGALAPNLKASVSGYYSNQKKGWGINEANGEQFWRSKSYGGRIKLVYDASDATTITLAGDYGYQFGPTLIGGNAEQSYIFSPIFQARENFNGPFNINSDVPPYYTAKEGGASVKINSRIGNINFLSISSFRKINEFFQLDYDGTPISFVAFNQRLSNKAYTQEFQLSSPSDGRFKWVAGLFYFSERPKIEPFTFFGGGLQFVFGTPPGLPFRLHSSNKGDSYAAYGQASLEVLPGTTATLGARYTSEKRSQTGFNDLGPGIVIPSSVGGQSRVFKKPTFRVSLDHKFSKDLMIYGSFNRGFNSGWFNNLGFAGYSKADNPVIEPETINAYEVGLKGQFFDRKLRINLAAFQYDYKNLQLQYYAAGTLVTRNAAGARIRGLDLDVQARPVDSLELSASLELLDPKFTDFPNAPFYGYLPSGEFAVLRSGDATGKSTTQAPHVSFNISATHILQTSLGSFSTTASLNYRGTTYGDNFEQFPLKKRTLLNLSERWEDSTGRFSATAWAKNLTNVRYDNFLSLVTPVGAVGQAAAPRTFGLTLGYKFGG